MCNPLIVLLYIFGQLVNVSPQSSLSTTITPNNIVDEYARLTLKCVAESNTYGSFEWILNDDVIATNYTDGREAVVGQGWRPEVYVATLNRKPKRTIFKLEISNSSRFDTGRWNCRANGTASDERRLTVSVRYKPDSKYPECQLDGTGAVQCTTQEGEPRVSLQWLNFDNTTLRAEEVTRDTIIYSNVRDVSLIPPDQWKDFLTCQITQSGEEENDARRCSISSHDIYSVASINLRRIDYHLNGFICTVSPPMFWKYLDWEFGTNLPVRENVSDANGTRVIFSDIDIKWNGTIIKCVLKWGAWNGTYKTSYLLVDNPTTALPLGSTKTPGENMKPGNTPTEVSEHEGDVNKPTNGVISPREWNTKSIHSTVYDGTEMFSTINTTVFSTRELMDSPAASSSSGTLIIILVIVIIVVVLFLTVVLCLWCSKKDSPTSTVI